MKTAEEIIRDSAAMFEQHAAEDEAAGRTFLAKCNREAATRSRERADRLRSRLRAIEERGTWRDECPGVPTGDRADQGFGSAAMFEQHAAEDEAAGRTAAQLVDELHLVLSAHQPRLVSSVAAKPGTLLLGYGGRVYRVTVSPAPSDGQHHT